MNKPGKFQCSIIYPHRFTSICFQCSLTKPQNFITLHCFTLSNSASNNFIQIIIIDEKIKKIFQCCMVTGIFSHNMTSRELFDVNFSQYIQPLQWNIFNFICADVVVFLIFTRKKFNNRVYSPFMHSKVEKFLDFWIDIFTRFPAIFAKSSAFFQKNASKDFLFFIRKR